MASHSDRARIWTAWVGANGWGELVGLGFVFACGFLVFRRYGEPQGIAAALLFVALAALLGAVEGVVVGYAQWRVLRRAIPGINAGAWVNATAIGGAVAWLLGMIPSTIASLHASASQAASAPVEEPPEALVMAMAVGMGLVGGLILSFFQWRVLRREARGAKWWLPANALAWAVAMPWIFWLVGATVAEARGPASVALFLLGIGVAGMIVGAIHGAFLVGLIVPGSEDAPGSA